MILIGVALLVIGIVNGIFTCSIMSVVLGFACLLISLFFAGYQTLVIIIVGVVFALIGLAMIATAYEHITKKKQSMSAEEKRNKNPKCATCHAKSFCPKQPGGIIDQYK